MERVKTFVNGGRFYPADINSIQDRAAELLEGTAAAIPSSHFAGRYYRATDTNDLYLDNGTTWEKIAGKEAIKAANVAPEAITDAKVVTGRALVETGNSYSALTSRANETEFEPSSTRTVIVILNAEKGGIKEVTVGGVVIMKVAAGQSDYTFICPPTKKWKVVMSTETTTLTSSYLII